MRPLDSFPWPSPPGIAIKPRWTGSTFELDGETSRLLAYDADTSHWSDALTSLHETEAGRDHPIDIASRNLAICSMQAIQQSQPIILDVGCSSGYVLEELRSIMPEACLIGADYLRDSLDGLAARMPDVPILQFDLRKCPLPAACVDGVTCLNVLEHIDDHGAALAEVHRILKPGGVAHVEVPAGPSLYDIYDEHLLHHRRYRLSELISLAQKCGFVIEKATHLGFSVFPAFWWVKRRNREKLKLPAGEKARVVAAQIRATKGNRIFAGLIRLETLIGRHFTYPLGIRCITRLRKS